MDRGRPLQPQTSPVAPGSVPHPKALSLRAGRTYVSVSSHRMQVWLVVPWERGACQGCLWGGHASMDSRAAWPEWACLTPHPQAASHGCCLLRPQAGWSQV